MAASKTDHLLDLEARRRLFQLIQDYPGLHEREAARQLRTSQALVNFHRAILEEHGLVRSERGDGTVRMYGRMVKSGPTQEERKLLAALRPRTNLHMVLVLLSLARPAKHNELVDRLGMGKSLVSFYLRKLQASGIVEKTAEGLFAVREPRKVNLVLTKFRPTPDLLEEFTELWSTLYGV